MPELLADEQTGRGAGDREEVEPVAGAEAAGLLEEAVGGELELAVDPGDPPSGERHGAVAEAAVRMLLDEADDRGQVLAGGGEAGDLRRFGRTQRHLRGEMMEPVAGEGELGEEEEIDPGLAGAGDPGEVPLEVRGEIAEPGVELREPDPHRPRRRRDHVRMLASGPWPRPGSCSSSCSPPARRRPSRPPAPRPERRPPRPSSSIASSPSSIPIRSSSRRWSGDRLRIRRRRAPTSALPGIDALIGQPPAPRSTVPLRRHGPGVRSGSSSAGFPDEPPSRRPRHRPRSRGAAAAARRAASSHLRPAARFGFAARRSAATTRSSRSAPPRCMVPPPNRCMTDPALLQRAAREIAAGPRSSPRRHVIDLPTAARRLPRMPPVMRSSSCGAVRAGGASGEMPQANRGEVVVAADVTST